MAKIKNDSTIKITIKPVIKASLWTIIKLRILANGVPEIKKLFKDIKKMGV